MIARIALAAVAVALAVLFAVELTAESRLADGERAARAPGPLPAARRVQALGNLRAGATLHPGTEALLARALVELRGGSAAAAERSARRAAEREPRNSEAWRALAATLRGRDAAAAQRAVRRARRLNPLGR